jgi:ketosteroid isomerase-like protein
MKPNVEIVHNVLEQIVNQKRIDAWDEYFSKDYVARGAPFVGLGFSRRGSEGRHIINAVTPGGSADGKLRVGDELLWAEDEEQRWDTYEGMAKGVQSYRGSTLKLGVRRGEQTLEVELTRRLTPGFDTDSDRAKSEMREFMTSEIPDLKVDLRLTLADGDMVVCLMEYRGTHARFRREAIWREAWFVRLSGGKIVESWPLPDIAAYCRQLGYRLSPPDA